MTSQSKNETGRLLFGHRAFAFFMAVSICLHALLLLKSADLLPELELALATNSADVTPEKTARLKRHLRPLWSARLVKEQPPLPTEEKTAGYNQAELVQLNSSISNSLAYPPAALAMEAQGSVRVRVSLEDGGVSSVTLIKSSGWDILDQHVKQKLAGWKFKKVNQQFDLLFEFSLQNGAD